MRSEFTIFHRAPVHKYLCRRYCSQNCCINAEWIFSFRLETEKKTNYKQRLDAVECNRIVCLNKFNEPYGSHNKIAKGILFHRILARITNKIKFNIYLNEVNAPKPIAHLHSFKEHSEIHHVLLQFVLFQASFSFSSFNYAFYFFRSPFFFVIVINTLRIK